MDIYFPQLDEALELNAELQQTLDTLNTKLDALNAKLDAIGQPIAAAPAAAVEPVQVELPLDTPKPAARKRERASAKPAQGNGEAPATAAGSNDAADRRDDADALRALAGFEAKRVTRTHGVGALRAAIRQVTGEPILQTDDVPVAHLQPLVAALRAM
jgi:hypothetical protein